MKSSPEERTSISSFGVFAFRGAYQSAAFFQARKQKEMAVRFTIDA
jgi:hypothetical protein